MFDKVKFLARNVIYIRNFSKRNIKEETKQIICKVIRENESSVLFRSKNLELRLIDGQDELLINAQRLRYNTFFNSKQSNRIDKDSYDYISKHLVVIDKDISDKKLSAPTDSSLVTKLTITQNFTPLKSSIWTR